MSGRLAWLLVALLGGCASSSSSKTATCPPCQCVCKQADAGTPADAAGPAACSSPAGPCPPCQCVCAAPGGSQGPAGPSGPGGPPGSGGATANEQAINERAADLMADASKKMNHRDGKGCLADLDKAAALSKRIDRSTAYMRGMCEMLAGKCQQGKQRMAGYLREELGQHPDRVEQTVDSTASIYCEGGDTGERERLLGAYSKLGMAGSETHTPRECSEWVSTIRTLLPRVKPRDADDHTISSMPSALPSLAARCYGRAGDCGAAYRSFVEIWEKDSKIPEDAKRQTFESSVERCKGKR